MSACSPSPQPLTAKYQQNIAQSGDALDLLRSLPNACSTLAFLDPQYHAVLDHLRFGNEGARQRRRAALPAMAEELIDAICREIARVLEPGGYLARWMDTYSLCEAHHLRVADVVKPVDRIAWYNGRFAMGKRTRRCGEDLMILQKPPISPRTWSDHGIRNRWFEKVDPRLHPHAEPLGLTARLIAAITKPGDLIIDPAAGSFTATFAALELNRTFVGCDVAFAGSVTAPAPPILGHVDWGSKESPRHLHHTNCADQLELSFAVSRGARP